MNFNTFVVITGLTLTTGLNVPAFALGSNPVNSDAFRYPIENAIAQKTTPTNTMSAPHNTGDAMKKPNTSGAMAAPHNTGDAMKKPNTSGAMAAPHNTGDAMKNPNTSGAMSAPHNTGDAMKK